MADTTHNDQEEEHVTRRDFIHLAATASVGVGAAMFATTAIHQLNPAADVLALSELEVDLSQLEPGQEIKPMWRGKPVIIRRRTNSEIADAQAVRLSSLPDPQSDADRVRQANGDAGKEEFLIMGGNCTHLGCIPVGNNAGDFGGWYCPCHGSHYDTSGRIRKGPAPKNLEIPPYVYTADMVIVLGKESV